MVSEKTQRYLERINYQGDLTPSAETLKQLQVAHLHSVPFENLSIHYDQAIILTEEQLFEKVVGRRRGGFCYELNGLFALLLRDLGFRVEKIAAEVYSDGSFSAPFDHMALLVELERQWLVDVGFGRSFIEPLLYYETDGQVQKSGTYKVEQTGDYWHYLALDSDGAYQPQYRFTQQAYDFPDYEARCHYQQFDPNSHFRKSRMATLPTGTGRITLSDLKFITTTYKGGREETMLADEAAFQKCLLDSFGLRL